MIDLTPWLELTHLTCVVAYGLRRPINICGQKDVTKWTGVHWFFGLCRQTRSSVLAGQ